MAASSEYLIELYAPKADCDVVSAATARLGRHIQVIRSIFVAEDETCFVLVEASSAEDVHIAARKAAVTVERVVETTFDIEQAAPPNEKEAR
jgi:hypothetical protein